MYRMLFMTLLFFGLSGLAYAEGTLKHPDWHPDGTKLIAEGTCTGSIDIYTLDLSSGALTNLLDLGETEGYPRWGHDGKYFVFHKMSNDRTGANIFSGVIGKDEAKVEIHRLTSGDFDIQPAPAPNSPWVAYSAKGSNGQDIILKTFDWAGLTKVFKTESSDDFPSWFPDGEHLLFTSNRSGERQIYKMNIYSGSVTPIELEGGPNFYGHIRYDGKMLVYASERTGDREIYLYDFETGEDMRLTNRPGRDGYPKFSPDGSRIAFHSQPDGQDYTHIVVMELETGLEEIFSCDSVR